MFNRQSAHSRKMPADRQILQALQALSVLLAGWDVAAEDASVQPAKIGDRLPYGQQPIDYFGSETADPLSRLNERLGSGEVRLAYEPERGYLRSLLESLQVPVESQMLVYSKTALNQNLVEPGNPRAIYFNDSVSVGWVPGAASIEVSALDPHKGAMFYTLPQQDSSTPQLRREERCLACHAAQSSLQVPGWLVRSFLTDAEGNPKEGYSPVNHALAFRKRFGGWYVTGRYDAEPHLGNLAGLDESETEKADDRSAYLTPHSDIVAQLVLHHQAHGLNLLVRAGYEHRLGRRSDAEEQLLRYLLFADEVWLDGPVEGISKFREWFAKQGPFDERGRSLRQFDLKTRLFKHRLSYLIYSPVFDGLPPEVRQRLYSRIRSVLEGESLPECEPFPHEERAAIVQILRATKKDWPENE